MEFELQLKPSPLAVSGALPRRGLQAASITAACLPASSSAPAPLTMLGAVLDDRHGLVRAAMTLLSHVQVHSMFAPHANSVDGLLPRRAKHAAAGSAIQPALGLMAMPLSKQHQRTLRRARRTASPSRGAASVTVAAGEVASKATGAAMKGAHRPLQQLLAGGVAGAVSKTLVAPLERVSTMLMTDGGCGFGVGEAVAHAWREGGLAGLFRGNAATLAKIFPASAIQFAVFHSVKDALLSMRSSDASPAQRAQQDGELSNAERLLAGAAAGAASASVTYPLESTRTLMSVAGGMEGSLVAVGRRVVASGGMRALYRGAQAAILADVMGNALGFTFYEIGNRVYKDMNNGVAAPPSFKGLIGAMSAACVMTFTMPLEVVRRRLQVQGTLGRPVLYRGTLDCISKIARKEGLRGFYRAALPAYLKVAPSIGCMYFLYEILTKHLAPTTPTGGTQPPANEQAP